MSYNAKRFEHTVSQPSILAKAVALKYGEEPQFVQQLTK